MFQRLFNLASFLSALLCVITVVLWLRSYWAGDEISWNLPQFGNPVADDVASLRSARGGMCFSFDRWAAWEFGVRKATDTRHRPGEFTYYRFTAHYPAMLNRAWFRGLGFEVSHASEPISPTSVGSGKIEQWNLVVPHWAAITLLGIVPLVWFRKLRVRLARQRDPRPRCPNCRYDLSGNISGICPECGTPVPAATIPQG